MNSMDNRIRVVVTYTYIYIYTYVYIYKFTRHVSTSDLPIPEAGDIRARKRF